MKTIVAILVKITLALIGSVFYTALAAWGLHIPVNRLDANWRITYVERIDSLTISEAANPENQFKARLACVDNYWDENTAAAAQQYLVSSISSPNQPKIVWLDQNSKELFIVLDSGEENVNLELLRRGLVIPNTRRQPCPQHLISEVEQAVASAQQDNLGIWSLTSNDNP